MKDVNTPVSSLCCYCSLSLFAPPPPASWSRLWFQRGTSPNGCCCGFSLTKWSYIDSKSIKASVFCLLTWRLSWLKCDYMHTHTCEHTNVTADVFNLQCFISCQRFDVSESRVTTDSLNSITLLSIHIQFGTFTTLTVKWNSVITGVLLFTCDCFRVREFVCVCVFKLPYFKQFPSTNHIPIII